MNQTDIVQVAQARHLAATGRGERIRTEARLSVSQVAEAIGVSVTTLWRWEHGERAPSGAPAIAWVRLLAELETVVGAA